MRERMRQEMKALKTTKKFSQKGKKVLTKDILFQSLHHRVAESSLKRKQQRSMGNFVRRATSASSTSKSPSSSSSAVPQSSSVVPQEQKQDVIADASMVDVLEEDEGVQQPSLMPPNATPMDNLEAQLDQLEMATKKEEP